MKQPSSTFSEGLPNVENFPKAFIAILEYLVVNGAVDKTIHALSPGFGVGFDFVQTTLWHSKAEPIIFGLYILSNRLLLRF